MQEQTRRKTMNCNYFAAQLTQLEAVIDWQDCQLAVVSADSIHDYARLAIATGNNQPLVAASEETRER